MRAGFLFIFTLVAEKAFSQTPDQFAPAGPGDIRGPCPMLNALVSIFCIQSLLLQEQTCHISSLHNKRLYGLQVLNWAIATLWLTPRDIGIKLLLWFFDS